MSSIHYMRLGMPRCYRVQINVLLALKDFLFISNSHLPPPPPARHATPSPYHNSIQASAGGGGASGGSLGNLPGGVGGVGVGGGMAGDGSGDGKSAIAGVGPAGGRAMTNSNQCLIFVNTLEACAGFVGRLRELLERDASAAFGGAGHDAERVVSCLQELGSTGALFSRAASDCLEEVRDQKKPYALTVV